MAIWVPAVLELIPESKSDQAPIAEYYTNCKSGKSLSHDLTLRAMNRLNFLGWKIDYSVDEKGGAWRWRYTHPDGSGKFFYGLFEVFQFLQEEDYCGPEAVSDYLDLPKWTRDPTRKSKAKSYLSSVGWRFYCNDKEGKEFRCTSPRGKCYFSLRAACKEYLDEKRAADEEGERALSENAQEGTADGNVQEVQESKRRGRKRKSFVQNIETKLDAKRESVVEYHNLPKWTRDQALKSKVKKYLSSVGWRVKEGKEFRCKSLHGKLYYSLRAACKGYLDEERVVDVEGERALSEIPQAENVQEVQGSKRRGKKRKSFAQNIETLSTKRKDAKEYCGSEAVLDYHKLPKWTRDPALKSQAKKYLSSVGWRVHYNDKEGKQFRCTSPRGKLYFSLRAACKGYIDEERIANAKAERASLSENSRAESSGTAELGNVQEVQESKRRGRKRKSNIAPTDVKTPSAKKQDTKEVEQIPPKVNWNGGVRVLRSRKVVLGSSSRSKSDGECSICHKDGRLIMCDRCPSSFHAGCLGLEEVPEGEWFCPYCCCKFCGKGKFSGDMAECRGNSIKCQQCELPYHKGCLRTKGIVGDSDSDENFFCSRRCEQISLGLQKLLGKAIPVGDKLTLTFLKPKPGNCGHDGCNVEDSTTERFNRALDVIHECFEPIKDPQTKRDLAEDVIFNRRSELNRLNFPGFYTVILENDDEPVTVATVRVYGEKVAELPLVATRFKYHQKGMCRILMNELEKALTEMGVESLVVAASSSVVDYWTSKFGLSKMEKTERLKFVDYSFFDFHSTTMLQKPLLKTLIIRNNQVQDNRIVDLTNDGQGRVQLPRGGTSTIADSTTVSMKPFCFIRNGKLVYTRSPVLTCPLVNQPSGLKSAWCRKKSISESFWLD